MKVLILISLALATSANAASPQFDLECVGFHKELKIAGTVMPSNEVPGRARMRVDLENKLWCNGSCTNPRPLQLDGDKINFIPAKTTPDGKWIDGGTIDRRTGLLSWFASPVEAARNGPPQVLISEQYRCSVATFSDIPQQAF